jgi:hypothetical protein
MVAESRKCDSLVSLKLRRHALEMTYAQCLQSFYEFDVKFPIISLSVLLVNRFSYIFDL